MVKSDLKRAVGGGNHDKSLKHFGGVCLEKQRCEEAKKQSLLRFELFRKIKKILDLIKILVNNENILPRKELSVLVPQYLSNFKLI